MFFLLSSLLPQHHCLALGSCAHAGVVGHDSVHEHLLNNWDDPVHYDCPNGGAMYRLTSHHGEYTTWMLETDCGFGTPRCSFYFRLIPLSSFSILNLPSFFPFSDAFSQTTTRKTECKSRP